MFLDFFRSRNKIRYNILLRYRKADEIMSKMIAYHIVSVLLYIYDLNKKK